MKILFITDTHGSLSSDDIENALGEHTPDCIICLGDIPLYDFLLIDSMQNLQKIPKGAVLGNHDGWNTFEILARRNIMVSDLNQRTFTLDGVSYGGLSGALKYKDDDFFAFLTHRESYEKMKELPAVDIIVSHDYPYFGDLPINDKYFDAHEGLYGLGWYVQEHHPQFLIHGHLHEEYQKEEYGCQLIGLYECALLEITKEHDKVIVQRL